MKCKNCCEIIEDDAPLTGFCSHSCKDEFMTAWADYRYEAMKERKLMDDWNE